MVPSSSHVTEIKHDLFVSFRGADIRHGFLSHLMKDLHRGKIDAYVDYRLERGDEISSSLGRAIEESLISLVVFSKDYASSKWCLEELVKMVECMERNNQIVLPIFYNVDPSDVRNQNGDYGAAFAQHEEDFQENPVKVQNWRYALQKAAELLGFHYPLQFENEADLVDEIVRDVSDRLSELWSSNSDDSSESNGLVGIDQNIARIKSFLTTETSEVLKLGIWGMGGIGKTTIARVVFDTFSPEYEGCCFLENVREELENHQLSYLREKLVSELLEKENHLTNGRGKLNCHTKRMLSRMKVLIVLDDVNTPNLLKGLIEPICLGPGSGVIVTSRDKQVFTAGGFHEIHMVKELNSEESLKLFCLNAFNESEPKMGYEELSKSAIAIAKGNPLALKVFGSHLHSKSKETWECALEKLKKYPDQNIQRVLRLSYDGLDNLEKKVFLDIAFFFREEDKGYVIQALDAWCLHGACGIGTLQDKALITISNDNRIQMHDLLQEMGWEIVRQESEDPGRRSRLRDPKEVRDVLNNNKGTDLVLGILLDVRQIGQVVLNVDSLKSMPKLRLIKLYSPVPVEVPMQIGYFAPEDFVNVNLKRIRVDDMKEELDCEPERLSRSRNNEDKCDDVLVLETTNVIGFKQLMPLPIETIGSALKELTSLGSEVHIKSVHYLFMDGCSVSTNIGMETLNSSIGLLSNNVGPMELSLLLEEMGQLNLTVTGIELLNSCSGTCFPLKCSEIDGLKLKTLPYGLPFQRSTYYHRLPNCREQDTGKPKLLVMFDGFRYSGEVSSIVLHGLSLPLAGSSRRICYRGLLYFSGLGITICLVGVLVLDLGTLSFFN